MAEVLKPDSHDALWRELHSIFCQIRPFQTQSKSSPPTLCAKQDYALRERARRKTSSNHALPESQTWLSACSERPRTRRGPRSVHFWFLEALATSSANGGNVPRLRLPRSGSTRSFGVSKVYLRRLHRRRLCHLGIGVPIASLDRSESSEVRGSNSMRVAARATESLNSSIANAVGSCFSAACEADVGTL